MNNEQLPPILDFNSNTNKGMLFDTRDGQSYPVVKIGSQIWLAENFRYLPSIKDKGDKYENSWVYENNNDYLDLHYGRFYDWDTAKSIAPEGWRLPSNKDFKELRDFIIKDNYLNENGSYKVGIYLKSANGWDPYKETVNNDKYGFNAKPAGYFNGDNFCDTKKYGDFWSTTAEKDSNYANYWNLHYTNEGFNRNRGCCNNDGFSVRLIKDIK